MKKRLLNYIIPIVFIIILIFLAIITSFKPNIGECKSYFCDVKAISLKTDISVKKDNLEIANIQGKMIRFFTDPLVMYDNNGKQIAYGSDEYHFITQDSHSILVNNQLTYEMVGKINIFGNKYDIYDANGTLIAHANFNMLHSYGTIEGIDGSLWADYHSNLFRKDYDVRVKPACVIDETGLLMIMASFYSDKAADIASNSNSNK